jgi:hypothetical protein
VFVCLYVSTWRTAHTDSRQTIRTVTPRKTQTKTRHMHTHTRNQSHTNKTGEPENCLQAQHPYEAMSRQKQSAHRFYLRQRQPIKAPSRPSKPTSQDRDHPDPYGIAETTPDISTQFQSCALDKFDHALDFAPRPPRTHVLEADTARKRKRAYVPPYLSSVSKVRVSRWYDSESDPS